MVLKMILSLICISLFTSCKKEFDCKCTIYFSSGASMKTSDQIKAGSNAEASDECNAMGQNYVNSQTASVSSHECNLYSN